MRATCEACARPQPVDWSAGDLCCWCGEAVRREVRCFWCAKWTPAAKYCRHCGAATVESPLYGAARMLKDAGSDRFSIPRQLTEFDPDQIENFTRIYQAQHAVAASLVAQTEFLESYLEERHWSAALEGTLAAELPWSGERLEIMRSAAARVAPQLEGLGKVRAIAGSTPFAVVRALATLARLALEDWTALDAAVDLLEYADASIRAEAALAISHWRVLYGPGLPRVRERLIEELRSSPIAQSAAVRLALLCAPTGAALPPEDFATALITSDVPRLETAARTGDPLQQYAAAHKLIETGSPAAVAEVLPNAVPDRQVNLLRLLARRKQPVPELRETLFAVAAATPGSDVLRAACDVLCLGCPREETLRMARAARGDAAVYQSILQRAGLPPESLNEFGEFLLESGAFRADQFGMADIAKKDRMPANFVPRHWPKATARGRIELCRFAERQLGEYGDEDLHRFLARAAITPDHMEVQSEAWSCLYRWYDSFGYPRWRPLAITPAAIDLFFDSAREFLNAFSRFLEDRAILNVSLQRDRIAELLRYPEPAALDRFGERPRETREFADALAGVMRDPEVDRILRMACTDCLGFLGTAAAFRAPVTALLDSFAGGDLDLQAARALERIRAAEAAQ